MCIDQCRSLCLWNERFDRWGEEYVVYFSSYCSSGAYWLMPFLSKWSSIYLPLDDQISGFSYFLGRDKPSFPVVMVHSPCPPLTSPYWKSHLIPTKTLLEPLNQGHKSHLWTALWSAKQRLMEMIPQICFQFSLSPLNSRSALTWKPYHW